MTHQQTPSGPPSGPTAGPRRRGLKALALSATLALALSSCSAFDRGGDEAEAAPEDQQEFTIGVVGANESHREVERIAEEELGYEIELVEFTEYTQPNPALTSGDIDANWFQHIAYLADYNVSSGEDLQPIGATAAVPLTLYSNEYDDVSEFTEGDTIAIPNDAVNQGRAINVLVQAGLLELSEETRQPEPRHIDEEASTVTVQPVAAQQTVNALESVQGSIINNNFAQDAELDPEGDGIFSDDPTDASAFPYINAFVTRAEDSENEALREIAAVYHDERVLEIDAELSAETSVPASDVTAEQLQESLVDYEDSLRNAGAETGDDEAGEAEEADEDA
ncbi:MetQ/NlpA family ABC transporter substrate-binding protein [Nesterenkonia aurantiaca]|uniref:D-methionine transport system substrate-binding protein n=1 Tax=Nesterenkonia aurantiaca TaxID=1436010 RepID=A0A4R7G6F2_9MICC|nr:MetQ/NlpA family ABC transporter substrate-binding protein [Nesterenkonia aurantiaca]TDS87019.1 D-methionine transport system substrate-binding protein [Nesterenkonia aurantiaca]